MSEHRLDCDTPDAGSIPFPEASAGSDRQHLAVAPDGTQYAVPSGMHERLRRTVATAIDDPRSRVAEGVTGREHSSDPDPKVALALAGWTLLQTDGMTDRLYVDTPDGVDRTAVVHRFATTHEIGRVTAAFHPSGRVVRTTDTTAVFADVS